MNTKTKGRVKKTQNKMATYYFEVNQSQDIKQFNKIQDVKVKNLQKGCRKLAFTEYSIIFIVMVKHLLGFFRNHEIYSRQGQSDNFIIVPILNNNQIKNKLNFQFMTIDTLIDTIFLYLNIYIFF